MSHYQTFGSARGDSNSVEKLLALALPRLEGISVLDVGCNEGFFCGYAAARGASRVVGIDCDETVINAGKRRFPGVEFCCKTWDALPAESFGLVLFLSSLHYAEDQECLVHTLMEHVLPNGMLVLEVGLAEGPAVAWTESRRQDGSHLYATRAKMESVLARYAYKLIGPSVPQDGDLVARWVFHVRHKKPMLLLLASASYTGKSTLTRALASFGVPYHSIDFALLEMFGTPPPGQLGAALVAMQGRLNPVVDGETIVAALFDSGLGSEFLAAVLGDDRPPITVLDGYLPEDGVAEAVLNLERAGWLVWIGASPLPHGPPTLEFPAGKVLSLAGDLAFVTNTGITGCVDGFVVETGRLVASGWATDASGGHPAVAVAGFAVLIAGREVASRVQPILRPDLIELGCVSEGAEVGFQLVAGLRSSEVAALEMGEVTLEFLALGNGMRASRLTIPPSARVRSPGVILRDSALI